MIRGTKRPMAPTAKQTLELRAAIHNRFDIEVRDAATGELKQKARAYNLICDAYWDRLLPDQTGTRFTSFDYFKYVLFGGGSGTPSVSDTQLFEKLGAKDVIGATTTYSADYNTGVYYRQTVVTLQAEEYVGDTLTEVGIGYDQTHIVTHAMLQDMNGNPISIEKTDTDVIKIYAIVFVHFQAGGWYSGGITLPGDLSFLSAFNGYASYQSRFRRTKIAQRTGASDYNATDMNVTVSRTNKTISLSTRIAAGESNLPIRAMEILFSRANSLTDNVAFWITPGSWFSPPAISAEAVGTGDGTAAGFSTAFPVKTAGTVYVDGVAASGVTMRAGPADAAHIVDWMNACLSGVTVKGYTESAYYIQTFQSSDRALEIALLNGAKSQPLENPFYSLGIQTVRKTNSSYTSAECTVLASDDLVNWSVVGTIPAVSGWAELSVPSALRNKRYWQIQGPANSSGHYYLQFIADVADTAHNIVFDTPPASGSVITADYTPDCIAKDENHVFDLNLVLTLGEYQEV